LSSTLWREEDRNSKWIKGRKMGRWLAIGQTNKRNGENMAYGRKEGRKYRKG
jgi:hypothetical protein